MEVLGLEPRAIRLKVECSNQLSYTSIAIGRNKNGTAITTVPNWNQRSCRIIFSGADRIRTCGPA